MRVILPLFSALVHTPGTVTSPDPASVRPPHGTMAAEQEAGPAAKMAKQGEGPVVVIGTWPFSAKAVNTATALMMQGQEVCHALVEGVTSKPS